MSKNINDEMTDLPFDWSGIDHKAISDGWYHFWGNNQITGFKTDKRGKHVRDASGNLVAYRTSIQRKLPRSWFNNLDDE